MIPVESMPTDTILQALKRAIEAEVPINPETGKPFFKVRHERFRETTLEEMPCLAIRYIADDATGTTRGAEDPQRLSLSEEAMELHAEYVIDTMLPPESDRDTALDEDEGEDPTGVAFPKQILAVALGATFRKGEEINTMGGVIWDARYDGTGDNEDVSNPHNVRLVERVTFVYRTRGEAPHMLLLGE